MSKTNILMKEVLLKYKSLDADIIHERNKLMNDEKLHNELCNILVNVWQTQAIVCSTSGVNNKQCSILDEKPKHPSQLPYLVWSKAQLKVNQQRDTIDLLLCDLVKAVIENEDASKVVKREKRQTQNVNIKSFLSAVLGALVVNMFYYYDFKRMTSKE